MKELLVCKALINSCVWILFPTYHSIFRYKHMNNKRKICFLICRTLQNRNTKSHWFITDKKKVFFHRHKCFMCPRLKIYYIGDNKTLNSIKNSKKSQQNGVFEPFFFGFPTRERRLFRKAPDCEKTKKTPWWFTWLCESFSESLVKIIFYSLFTRG